MLCFQFKFYWFIHQYPSQEYHAFLCCIIFTNARVENIHIRIFISAKVKNITSRLPVT